MATLPKSRRERLVIFAVAVPSRSWGRFSPPLFRSSLSVFAAAPRWNLSLLPFSISWLSCTDSGPVGLRFHLSIGCALPDLAADHRQDGVGQAGNRGPVAWQGFQYPPERISRSTGIVHGLVLCSYPARAITLLPFRRLAACIISMSVEPRKFGPDALVPALNAPNLNFEQGQVGYSGSCGRNSSDRRSP
jgi:hypothetical protein